jgi:C1A family cysteine protease
VAIRRRNMNAHKGAALTSILTLSLVILGVFGQSYAIDLNDVQAAIHEKGTRWIAGSTKVSELPDQLKKSLLGLGFSEGEGEAQRYVPQAAELPSYFDWRDEGMVSPVKDQGAAVGVLESLSLLDIGGLAPDLSEQFPVSYNLTNNGCNGGYMANVAGFLERMGTVSEECLPYRASGKKLPLPCEEWRDELIGITAWSKVTPTVDVIKAAVYESPLAAGYYVYADFMYYTGGVYEYVTGPFLGGHAIIIVGWDDVEECFIVKNSWGGDWGEDGYFRIAYSQVINKVRFGSDAIHYDGIWALP